MLNYKSKKIVFISLNPNLRILFFKKMVKRSMDNNGLFISVIVNMLFRNFYHFLKLLSTCFNTNILPLEKLEPLVKSCPFCQVSKFYISNRVNNNCYSSFLYIKKKILIFKKSFFAHQKKLTEKFQKTIN